MLNILKKANIIEEKIKLIHIKKSVYIKSYIQGFIISLLIFIIPILFLINLLIFWFFIFLVQIALLICLLGVIYFTLYFTDKILITKEPLLNDINLAYLRNITFIMILFTILLVFIIYASFFKWW